MLNKKTVEDAEHRLFAAIKASDVTVLDKLLYDKLLALLPDGNTVTKQMDLASHRAGTMVIDTAVLTIEDIQIVGDTAISITSMQAKGMMMGTPLEGLFRYMRCWKEIDEEVKVIGASIYQISS